MSVQSNITRIEGGKASLKTSINNKLNSTQQKITNEHIEDYHLFVDQISGGGGVGTLEIYENGVYDVSDYANVYVKITELVPCTSISFNKSESTILPDETDTIIATYTPTETTDAIVWNSDNITVATVTRIAGTDSAVITYVGAGTCHITATCGSFSVSCTVTCDSGEIHCTSITLDQHTLTLDEPVQEKPCTAITLDKSTASVGIGETVTVTATLTPSDTTDTLTVTSSDTTKATVTLSGNVATITDVADGSSNITFTCGDISEVCVCTVSAELTPILTVDGRRCQDVRFSNNSNMSINFYEIIPGASYEITSTGGQLGTSWGDCSTDSGTNEDYAFFQNGNLLRIHTTATSHYLAVSCKTSNLADLKVVKVETVPCTGIAFDPTSITFTEIGKQRAFTTVLTPSNTTDVVHLTNDNPTACSMTTAYYKDGQLTAVADGSAVITATCGNATATMNVTVTASVPTTGNLFVSDFTQGKFTDGVWVPDTDRYAVSTEFRVTPGKIIDVECLGNPGDYTGSTKPSFTVLFYGTSHSDVSTITNPTIDVFDSGLGPELWRSSYYNDRNENKLIGGGTLVPSGCNYARVIAYGYGKITDSPTEYNNTLAKLVTDGLKWTITEDDDLTPLGQTSGLIQQAGGISGSGTTEIFKASEGHIYLANTTSSTTIEIGTGADNPPVSTTTYSDFNTGSTTVSSYLATSAISTSDSNYLYVSHPSTKHLYFVWRGIVE